MENVNLRKNVTSPNASLRQKTDFDEQQKKSRTRFENFRGEVALFWGSKAFLGSKRSDPGTDTLVQWRVEIMLMWWNELGEKTQYSLFTFIMIFVFCIYFFSSSAIWMCWVFDISAGWRRRQWSDWGHLYSGLYPLFPTDGLWIH